MNENGVWARVGKHRLNLSSCASSTIGKCLSRGKAIVEGGKVRVVHSGLNTSFWWDNWTNLGPIWFLIQGPFKREECNISVAEAANFQGGWYNLDISFVLPDFVMNCIKDVPVNPHTNQSDCLAWKGRKDGNFDLKSAYTLALRVGVETPHHLFYFCNPTRSVWQVVVSKFKAFDYSDFQSWIKENASSKLLSAGFKIPHGMLFAYIIWHIWIARNNKLFNDDKFSPRSIVHLALARAAEFTFLTPNAIAFKQNYGLFIGLKRAKELGIQLLEVECDCVSVVDLISCSNLVDAHPLAPLIYMCRCRLRDDSSFIEMILCSPIRLILVVLLIFLVLFVVRVILFKTGFIYTVKRLWRITEDYFHVHQFFKVPELNESMRENQLYKKVSLYLHSLPSIEDSDFTNLVTSAGKNQNDIVLCLDPKQTIIDHFLGARVFWFQETAQGKSESENRTFILKIRKADKRRILRPYFQHIHAVADEIEQQGKRDLKLFMNSGAGKGRWRSVPFTHPSTLDTLAMESDLKNKIKSDLESFLKAKQYYNRLGRVWKRSFLLYGPSGTGKSSFVAAMANFLGYDVYDIELYNLHGDSDMRLLLLETTPKSIVVIEDLDRFLMEKKPTGVSFSGILNFMDGILNSCCAEERIMVFTMTSKDRIDPNLLRPGRVDVHIHFPLCDFSSFKTLASSYLGVKDHKLFSQVEEIFQSGASLSPAEIGELMIANRNSPSRAIKSVINALQTDGDGRGSGMIGRRSDNDEELDGRGDGGSLCREGPHTVKDIRKLYGLFRLRSDSKSQSFDAAVVDPKAGR
ncbi:AAA-ATPase [Senna tora]|uniref:AAA-ATPase n=1 Tax=Senna tora TaxID=362788 RepID=A0A834WK48_9FABA|nr:AAA-ATPase [Senna tora]